MSVVAHQVGRNVKRQRSILRRAGRGEAMAPKYDGLSHCQLALAFAVLMDLLGVVSLLLGVFAPLEIQGRDFGDLLVYSGALLLLMSLAGWVMWYSGNIEGLTSKKDLGGIVNGAMDRLARSLSRKIRLPRTRSSPT
uniref:Transmembrane protein 238 n=2 Tax=Gasterosteus aculeatus aculeatus TaxID=481459 RepID=A0AAQ4P7Q2_GASAC